MYPETLFKDTTDAYFYERDFFVAEQLAHAYLHRDYRIGMHSHEFYEINIIMSGSGRHYIGAASLDTRKGDVFVIPPETEHGYFPHPSLDIFHILIRSDFFSRYASELHKTGGFSLLFNIEPHLRIQSGKAFHLQLDARGLEYDWETLMPRARAWTVSHNGCSPRIARQFVDLIEGETAQDDA